MATEKAFKVGDRVRINCAGSMYHGQAGIIEGIGGTLPGGKQYWTVSGTSAGWTDACLLSSSPEPSEGKAEPPAPGAPVFSGVDLGYSEPGQIVYLDQYGRVVHPTGLRPHTGPTAAEFREAYGKPEPRGIEALAAKESPWSKEMQRVIDDAGERIVKAIAGQMLSTVSKPEPKRADPYELPRGATHPLLGRHDPYTGRFLDKEVVTYAIQKADDEIEGRRDRLVASLKSEMVREVTPPRFPHEGRSDRVYRVNR